MPKKGVFHIINRSNNKMKIFHEDEDFLKIYNLIYHYKNKYPFEIYHYSFMSTHLHFQINTENIDLISRAIRDMCLAYYQYYKLKYSHQGHLWNGRFKSIAITNEQHLIRCARYIELNPFKAGIINNPSDYRWSSCSYYTNGQKDALITHNPYLASAMGKDLKEQMHNFQQFLKEGCAIDWDKEEEILGVKGKRGRRPVNNK